MAACPDEANEFFDYVSSSSAGSLEQGGDLQIMFGIGGERDLTERVLRSWRAGGTRRRYGWATRRGNSASSTSTANCQRGVPDV